MKEITLRPYQQDAIDRIIRDIEKPGNSLCSLPTGSGKSIIIAEVARQINQDVLILSPSKEITEQNLEKLMNYVSRDEIGVYSASMNEKVIKRFTLATIGSIYKHPEFFEHFKIVLIDEAHGVNVKELNTMFSSFLVAIGNPKCIGFSATCWRLSTKSVPMWGEWSPGCETERITVTKFLTRTGHWNKETNTTTIFWKRIIVNVTMEQLISEGYLIRPTYYNNSTISHADIPVNKSESDFDLEAYERLITSREDGIMDTIRRAQEVSTSVLVFCSSVEQAMRLQVVLKGSAVVSANTNKKERERIIAGFKNGTIKTVFNVSCLTTGFDHPALDCIILLRPTRSIGLYCQMLGRGVRIAEGKTTCKIIDFTGTIKSLGRMEMIHAGYSNGKWDIITEKGAFHDKILYRFHK